MADGDDRVERGDDMWQRFLDLVPPERFMDRWPRKPPVVPVPEPPREPVPKPVSEPDSDAAVRAIQLQMLKDRQAADQKIRDIQREALQDALDSLQRMHETQKKMNP